MQSVNPYRAWIEELVIHQQRGARLPLGSAAAAPTPRDINADAKVLLFSPHPDDECIVGGLPLRLQREQQAHIINVVVTLGSKVDRREARWAEVSMAAAALGFDVEQPPGGAMEAVRPDIRTEAPERWDRWVQAVVKLLNTHRPFAVCLPHAADGHATHQGVHALVMDALNACPDLVCWIIETEFWAPMQHPNVMVEIAPDLLADLVAALTCHEGEVRRNPYHLRLPAWMQDNVRRGAELLGGQGAAAPEFLFATLYRCWHRTTGPAAALPIGSPFIKAADSLEWLVRPPTP